MKANITFWVVIQEFVGWLLVASIAYILLSPITNKLNYYYLYDNLLFIAVGVTYLRYFIFYNSIPYLQPNIVRFILFTVNLVLWVYILNRYELLLQLHNIFYISEFGTPIKALSNNEQKQLLDYLYKEVMLSGLVALIAVILFNLRMIGAYWRVAKVRFSNMMQS